MVWASSWVLGPLLGLLLSPNPIIKGNSTSLARIGPAPEHRGHRPFLGGPGAKELTLFRDELMLLALPQGLGQKLSFFLGAKVVGLQIHEACRLRDKVLLPDSVLLVDYATARHDQGGQLSASLKGGVRLAAVDSLGVLG